MILVVVDTPAMSCSDPLVVTVVSELLDDGSTDISLIADILDVTRLA